MAAARSGRWQKVGKLQRRRCAVIVATRFRDAFVAHNTSFFRPTWYVIWGTVHSMPTWVLEMCLGALGRQSRFLVCPLTVPNYI